MFNEAQEQELVSQTAAVGGGGGGDHPPPKTQKNQKNTKCNSPRFETNYYEYCQEERLVRVDVVGQAESLRFALYSSRRGHNRGPLCNIARNDSF